MAPKNTAIKRADPAAEKKNLIVNEIRVMTVDLSSKDIRRFRIAQDTAISVYYPNQSLLYDIYEKISMDGHLTGIINKRISAVVNKGISFQKADKKVDEMDELIQSKKFRGVVTEIMNTRLWGLTGFEFIPGAVFDYNLIPRKHIKPKWGVISIDQNANTGFAYKDIPNIWVLSEGNWGLLVKCAPYAIWKSGNWGDWAQYIEIFGQPLRVAKYAAHDEQTKSELKQAMDEAGSALALLIPKEADIELKDGKASNGDGKLQDGFKDALNAEMSVIILGNTETTVSSKSSGYAQAQEHGQQQDEVTKDDLTYVINELNSPEFIAILKTYRYPVDGGKFVFEKAVNPAEITAKVALIQQGKSMGIPIDDDVFYETTGIPKPANYDQLKAKQEQQEKQPKPGNNPANDPADDDMEGLAATLSAFDKIRIKLADFFDLPRR